MSSTMRRALRLLGRTTASATVLTVGTYWVATRKTSIERLPPTYVDPSPVFRLYKPVPNPVTADVATRRVAMNDLPIDLQDHIRNGSGQELTRRFCAGLWSSAGYEIQRRVMESSYRAIPHRSGGLWERAELRESDFAVGTVITDHFEVTASNDHSIELRCGDSPTKQDHRDADGVMRISTQYLPESDEVELSFLSCFWMPQPVQVTNHETMSRGALPAPVGKSQFAAVVMTTTSDCTEFLHRIYSKILVESAVNTLYKPT